MTQFFLSVRRNGLGLGEVYRHNGAILFYGGIIWISLIIPTCFIPLNSIFDTESKNMGSNKYIRLQK